MTNSKSSFDSPCDVQCQFVNSQVASAKFCKSSWSHRQPVRYENSRVNKNNSRFQPVGDV